MAVRAVNSCCLLRSTTSSSSISSTFSCRIHQFQSFRCSNRRKYSKLGFRPSKIMTAHYLNGGCHGGLRFASIHSLVDSVMEELEVTLRTTIVRAGNKVGAVSNEILLEDKLKEQELRRGLLLEFKKDSERALLAVVQKPDGKKNWMVHDQNGVTSSIKPQQITYIIPGVENFDHSLISEFIQKAQNNLDPVLLEFAWNEFLENNKSVTVEDLAEVIFGSSEPVECYCAHLLLSKDEIHFSKMEVKGSHSVYVARSPEQAEELQKKKHAEEAAEKEFQELIDILKSAKGKPPHAKHSKSSWIEEEKSRHHIESLESFAIDTCKNDDQRRTAGMILKSMGLAKTATAAVNLLVDIGYFPVHVNLDMLKLNIRTDHSEDIVAAADNLLLESTDMDKVDRKDLSHLKVYAIDVDEADELDDALSAMRLQDGRIKVWIHVADPTCIIRPGSKIDKEAMARGTSVFLPTATYPMFPEKLAMEGMSLKQGERCRAITVSVLLHPDGSVADYSVDSSVIRPTYMLTYESASELLHLNLEEEADLRVLSEAAALRLRWRRQQGAIDLGSLEARVKVVNPDDPEPQINLYVENQAEPAMRLVTEMMILCGEVIATFGSCNNVPLPYRGQPQSDIDLSAFSHLPEGPVRSSAVVKIMRAAELDFRKPIRHSILGIPGYVQFTSPIRRYIDLLAHYQVKAFLRDGSPPFSAGQLEGIAAAINMNFRLVKKLCNSSLRYWILEYLRRQPKQKYFRALVLRFIKDRIASLLLIEVGHQASAWVSLGVQIGDEIQVRVVESCPREDFLSLKEVLQ